MRLKTVDMIILALLGALLVIVQMMLAFLPNIELVSLLVYIYAKVYRKRAFIPIYIFVILEGLLYGFSIWWVTYLYVWAVLAVISIVTGHERSTFVAALVLALYGLGFGLLCSIPTFIIAGPGGGISFFLAGLPFDAAHFAGNTTTALVLYYPLYTLLHKLNRTIHPDTVNPS